MATPKKTDDYKRKIKTPEELKAILADPPRKKTVVMCHGTFDIVHPGHLRHLMYAKERGDILVASLTSDAHIYKANLRPFIPQDLRAMNLASIEIVDYVIIDANPTPIENLKLIKPDIFAKGYDYFGGGLPPKTQEEKDVVESYGGEMLFTPGDVVYSSSYLIENSPPKLAGAKLFTLMETEKITFDDLRSSLDKIRGLKVHVIGDTIVDSYTHCTMSGGMTKTPTISVKYERQLNFSGGAAVVAKHMRSAGADVVFTTVMGNDELKDFVVSDLKEHGIEVDVVADKTRPTTNKNAFVCQGYHLLKMNKLDNRVISDKIVDHFCSSLSKSDRDIFIFSDFRHGIFSKATIPKLVAALPENSFKVADSQVASRWGNILEFQGFDLITPNEREARFAVGDQDSVVRPLALELYNKANCKILMLTLGERGVMTYRHNGVGLRAFFTVDAFADRVVDAVGSGDAFLSYSSMVLYATKSEVIATILGSFAAAIACEKEGNHPVTPEDVLKKIETIEKQINFIQ